MAELTGFGLVLGLGLLLLMPAAALRPVYSHPTGGFCGLSQPSGLRRRGLVCRADFLFLAKVFGTYNGTAPDSILSFGYRTQEGTVYQLSWWDQWFSENPNPRDKLQIITFSSRFKTYETDCYRQWATWGPRAILTSEDFALPGGKSYSVDNNMVGLYIGCMNEWYLGTNPLGAFSFTLDGDIGAYANFIRQAAGSPFGSNTFNSSPCRAAWTARPGSSGTSGKA